jgi:translation initiation factor 1
MTKGRDAGRLVYSSEHGRICPRCQRPQAQCRCNSRAEPATASGSVRVRREKKGRRGKTVTTIHGLPLSGNALSDLAAELKRRCGTGGSVKDGVVEIQGDHVDGLIELLAERGYRPKRAGG